MKMKHVLHVTSFSIDSSWHLQPRLCMKLMDSSRINGNIEVQMEKDNVHYSSRRERHIHFLLLNV